VRRLLLAGGAAAVIATGGIVLAGAPASPASAGLLPSPLPSLPVPLPSLLPTVPPPVPVPTPVAGVVDQVAGALPQLPSNPIHPSQSGQPASAAGSGGAGAGTGGDDTTPYQPSGEEQAALPPEPQRVAMEGQQGWLATWAPALDQWDGAPARAVGGGDGRFIWPITFSGRPPITQRFGCTDVPGEPYSAECATHRFHTGIDLASHTGTPVYAADSGVAHVFRSDSGYGNHVLIAHGGGWFTLYAHLSAFMVREGEPVHRGDPIGLVGSTGFSTGPHLHFEIRSDERPLDPCPFLRC